MKITDMIFDIDGTIIDTKLPILKTWKKTLSDFGYDFDIKQLEVIFGITARMGLKKLNLDIDPEHCAKIWAKNYYEFKDEAKYFEGTEKMLENLKKNGCNLGIVSSRAKHEYEEFFPKFRLDRYFDRIVLEEDTKRHKPDREPLDKYIEITGAKRQNCIYIGDMPTDVLCANNADIISAIIRYNKENPDTTGAKYIFDTPCEIFEFYLNNR